MGAETPAAGGEKKPFINHEGRPNTSCNLFDQYIRGDQMVGVILHLFTLDARSHLETIRRGGGLRQHGCEYWGDVMAS